MRIDLNPGTQPAPETNRSRPQNNAANSTANQGLDEDKAQLSGAHVQVQTLAAQAAQLPEIREQRVQALRQAVLGGHYHAKPEKTAGAMMTHMMARSTT